MTMPSFLMAYPRQGNGYFFALQVTPARHANSRH
jgi:hypothetical protein